MKTVSTFFSPRGELGPSTDRWLAEKIALDNCEYHHRAGDHRDELCPLSPALCDWIRWRVVETSRTDPDDDPYGEAPISRQIAQSLYNAAQKALEIGRD